MSTSLRFIAVLAALAAAHPAAHAADATATPRPVDQMFTLDMQPVVMPRPSMINASTMDLTEAQLRDLITDVQSVTIDCGAACSPRPDTYYILHLLEHVPGQVATRRQRWYVYYSGWANASGLQRFQDLYTGRHFREARLFGARRLTFLYVHYNVAGVLDDESTRRAVLEEFRKTVPNNLDIAADPAADAVSASAQVLAAVNWLAQYDNRFNDLAERAQKDVAEIQKNPTAEATRAGKLRDDYIAARNQLLPVRAGTTDRVTPLLSTIVADTFAAAFGKPRAGASTFTLVSAGGRKLAPEVLAYREPSVRVPAPAKGSAGAAAATTPPAPAPVSGQAVIAADYLPIFYDIEITKKQPDNQRNLFDLLKTVLMAGAATLHAGRNDYALAAIQEGMQINYTTSDINIKGYRGERGGTDDKAPKEIGTNLYDNEGKHWVDFSFALPAKGIEDLKLEPNSNTATPGTLTGRKVTNNDVFAAVNLFPGRVDTKRFGFRLVPQFIYGVGITKKPLNRQLFAVGIGTSIAQPFFGRMYARTEDIDAATNKTVMKTSWSWTWGVNLQPRAVLELFKSAGGK